MKKKQQKNDSKGNDGNIKPQPTNIDRKEVKTSVYKVERKKKFNLQ
jgi:hypothetical protein